MEPIDVAALVKSAVSNKAQGKAAGETRVKSRPGPYSSDVRPVAKSQARLPTATASDGSTNVRQPETKKTKRKSKHAQMIATTQVRQTPSCLLHLPRLGLNLPLVGNGSGKRICAPPLNTCEPLSCVTILTSGSQLGSAT